LNHEIHQREVAAGLWEKKGKKIEKATKDGTRIDSTQIGLDI